MLQILGTVFAGLIGLSFGSFLNVCVLRWPRGESVVRPRSHCRKCGRMIPWWENVPVFSWLALRGRCRACRAWIGWRYPLGELAVGVLFAIAGWQWLGGFLEPGDSPLFFYSSLVSFVGKMILCWLLVALAILDAENLWLPDWLTWPGVALGFIAFVLEFELSSGNGLSTHSAETMQHGPLIHGALRWLLGVVAAAGLVLLIRWSYWLIRHREGIGLGDAKLMAMLAAWLGLPGAVLAFALGAVLGASVAVVLLVRRPAKVDGSAWGAQKLPLGTFLCIGGMISCFWGQQIIAAYLRLAGF